MTACTTASIADLANSDCACVHVDRDALRQQVEAVLRAHALPASLADSHPHLFSALPIFVAPDHLAAVAEVAAALERVVARPAYRDAVLAWAPQSSAFDPGSPGGLLGLDFHITAEQFVNAFAVAMVAALVAGLYPAWRMARAPLASDIREE